MGAQTSEVVKKRYYEDGEIGGENRKAKKKRNSEKNDICPTHQNIKLSSEVVKAFVVLAPEYISHDQEALIKELQDYVKTVTAPYKYPRKMEFVPHLPKTISGKIRRNELRKKEWGHA